MNKEKLEELVVEYLNGAISSQQKEKLRGILQEHGFTLNQLSDLENIFNQLGEFHVPEPSEKMDDRFYSMLEEMKEKAQKREQRHKKVISMVQSFFPQKYIPQIAYSLLLLLIG